MGSKWEDYNDCVAMAILTECIVIPGTCTLLIAVHHTDEQYKVIC